MIFSRRDGGRPASGAVHAPLPRLLAERPVPCADATGGMRAWSAAWRTASNARGLVGATHNAHGLAGAVT